MNEQSMTLDLRKTGFGKRVVIRQNDYHGITLAVDVTDGSKAYSVPAAAKCCLMARMLGSYVRDGGCTVEGGRIVYTADERMFGASGTAEAYFRIEVDGAAYSTEGFQLVVERAADRYAQLSEAYDTEVDRAIRDAGAAAAKADDAAEGAKAAGGRADAAAKKAGDAAAKAEAWAGKVDDATDAANNAAEKAEAAAQQATAAANKVFPAADNILVGDASGAAAHAEDAFAGAALRGIAVEGACRQDGTPSPDNPVPIQVIEHPAVNVVGRNLLEFAFPASDASYSSGVACIPKYASSEKNISLPYTTLASSMGFGFVQELMPGSYTVKASNAPQKATVNVAGYASHEDISSPKKSIWHEREQKLDAAATFRVDGEQPQWVVFCFAAEWGDGTNKITYPADFKAVVEYGGTATEYAPYTSQELTFTLPDEHPYLAKLPDGTADTIEVDEAGNVELVARVGVDRDVREVSDFSQGKFYSLRTTIPRFASSSTPAGLYDKPTLCSALPYMRDTTSGEGVYRTWTGIYVKDMSGRTKEEIQAEVDRNAPLTVVAAIPETRYKLAPIEMPKAQDSIVNAWTDAEVTPSTSIRYIRDVNIVIANIESAIASITQG